MKYEQYFGWLCAVGYAYKKYTGCGAHSCIGAKGAFTFQSATHGFQYFSYLVSATNVVDRMFATIFLVLDLHSWFVWDMYKTKMTTALSHKFYVNFCFFQFDLNFIAAVHFAQSRHLSMKFLFKSR